MAKKISQLGLAGDLATNDLLSVIDVSDTFMASTGTNKRITMQTFGNNLPVTVTGSSASRSLKDRFADTVNVKDFGAVGDGVTNDTAAIQAGIDKLNTLGGGKLLFPRGVYITNKLTVYSKIWLCGDGRTTTTLRLAANANTDLIYGQGSDAWWGTNTNAGIEAFGLFDITLDGNRSNNTVAGSCVAVYGEELYFSNLFVTGARDNGIRTDWWDGDSAFGMESHFSNVRIDNCGKDGWLCDGPHDSVFVNVIVIDASCNEDKTFSGIVLGPRMNGRFIGCHVWNRASSFRHSAAVRIATNGGGNDFSACHFEGAWDANVIILCNGNTFDDSCHIYAPWNGVNIYLGGTATRNVIRGRLGHPTSIRPPCVGVVLGSTIETDYVAHNVIDVTTADQLLGDVACGGSAGYNVIRIRGIKSSGPIYTGNLQTTDSIDARVAINGINTRVNNLSQRTSIAIGASGSVTWTFPFAFESTPRVTFTPIQPSGSITSGIWVSSVGAASVTIFNNNAVSMTLNISAEAV